MVVDERRHSASYQIAPGPADDVADEEDAHQDGFRIAMRSAGRRERMTHDRTALDKALAISAIDTNEIEMG